MQKKGPVGVLGIFAEDVLPNSRFDRFCSYKISERQISHYKISIIKLAVITSPPNKALPSHSRISHISDEYHDIT